MPRLAVEATYDMHATKDSINHFAQYTKKSVGNGFKILPTARTSSWPASGAIGGTPTRAASGQLWRRGRFLDYVDGKPVLNETVTDAPEGMRDALLIYASNDTICCVIDPNAVTSGYSEVDKAAPEIWNEGMDDSMVIPSTSPCPLTRIPALPTSTPTSRPSAWRPSPSSSPVRSPSQITIPLLRASGAPASTTIWPFSRALMTVQWKAKK